MSFLAAYIMRGRMQAIMVASVLALLSLIMPPISIVSSAAVALVTLRKGAYEGLLVLLSSCVAAAVLGVILLGDFQVAMIYGLVLWLPVWLMAFILREGRHLSLALTVSVLLGIIFVIGFYFYFGEPGVMWLNVLTISLQQMVSMSDAPVEQIQQSIEVMSQFMTGILSAGGVIGLLLGLFLARWWQSALYNPGGFRTEFLDLKAATVMAVATIVTMSIAWLADGAFSELAWNILIVLSILYMFIGIAVVHSLISTIRAKRFLLPSFYLAIFLIPHALFIVVFLGLSDTWLNFRKNISNLNSV